MPSEAKTMLHREARTVTVRWLLTRKSWQSRLVRTVESSSFVSLLLLLFLIRLTTTDFSSCTLHKLSFSPQSLRVSPLTSDNQFDPTECLMSQSCLIADASSRARFVPVTIQSLYSHPKAREHPTCLHDHITWQDRAPPTPLLSSFNNSPVHLTF